MELTPRKKEILGFIAETHIETAEPVGSETIVRRYRIGLSPATVRHDMCELEQEGFVTHPHPSAGKVPTDLGYRYYVDHLAPSEMAVPPDVVKMLEDFKSKLSDLDEWIEVAAHLISKSIEELCFVSYPRMGKGERLLLKKRKSSLSPSPCSVTSQRLHLVGAYYLLEQPEFRDPRAVKMLFHGLEERERFLKILEEYFSENDTRIIIGSENRWDEFENCAFIFRPYYYRGVKIGSVGVLGPRRMRYARVVPMFESLAHLISSFSESL